MDPVSLFSLLTVDQSCIKSLLMQTEYISHLISLNILHQPGRNS